MTDRLQAAREAMADQTRCPICGWPFAADQEHGCVLGDCSYRTDDPVEWARIKDRREALALLQSGPDTPRQSSRETADLVRRLKQIEANDWRVSMLAHTSDTAGDAARVLAALDAAAEGQGDLLKAVTLMVTRFRSDISRGYIDSGTRQYVLDMLERYVPLPSLPVSASKPEGA